MGFENLVFWSTIIIGLALVGWIIFGSGLRQRRREEAESSYKAALAKLQGSPADPLLREQALQLGRRLSQLTRSAQGTTLFGAGVTLFDEIALKNDLDAATAGVAVQLSTNNRSQRKGDLGDRLKKLDELRSKKLVSDAEFEERRRAILDEI